MIKIQIFHTGKVRVDVAIPYKEKNPLAVTGFLRGSDKKIELPVSCYLIEHPKGRVLIDSGWHAKYATEKPHRFLGLLDQISAPILREGESIDCQLAALGLRPKDIDFLFLSHLDFDHTSGLELLRDVRRIQAAREELADADRYFFRYVKDNWKVAKIEPFSYQKSKPSGQGFGDALQGRNFLEQRVAGIGPVGKSFDVFGDGQLLLVNTPGHSHGLFSAVVRDSHSGRYVVLAGDAIYTQKSIREKRLPGFTVDAKLARKSLEWICGCVADENCLLVAANHDPEIEPQVILL